MDNCRPDWHGLFSARITKKITVVFMKQKKVDIRKLVYDFLGGFLAPPPIRAKPKKKENKKTT